MNIRPGSSLRQADDTDGLVVGSNANTAFLDGLSREPRKKMSRAPQCLLKNVIIQMSFRKPRSCVASSYIANSRCVTIIVHETMTATTTSSKMGDAMHIEHCWLRTRLLVGPPKVIFTRHNAVRIYRPRHFFLLELGVAKWRDTIYFDVASRVVASAVSGGLVIYQLGRPIHTTRKKRSIFCLVIVPVCNQTPNSRLASLQVSFGRHAAFWSAVEPTEL
jgi:hypothetical protein